MQPASDAAGCMSLQLLPNRILTDLVPHVWTAVRNALSA